MNLKPIWQAQVQQQVYRELLDAFSYPGKVKILVPLIAEGDAIDAVLATLLDGESRLADTTGRLSTAQWSLLQAQQAQANDAQFIVAEGKHFTDFCPNLGSLDSPEHGATVMLMVNTFKPQADALALQLTGPGIATASLLYVDGLSQEWIEQRAQWNEHFPLGIDMILASQHEIVALPRTTRIQLQAKDN
ncbi:phosphonate C-P lyase system protein PhnH [Acinetobacter pittii]|uniref:phosphonate C-P lyase system protein PhnH n=1 Tax=Acinetobacter pittii TaxID=48296 RepID=UPI0021CD620C|nr:phosphonate C-P lyase system protein PhnH [Acinetobacter pittii]MCU4335455.1 phosphonate C-P lyase system protein PhnH [Acinetobacter pittii]